jgi:hypothetical protein
VIAIELAETIVVTLCGRAAIDVPAGHTGIESESA